MAPLQGWFHTYLTCWGRHQRATVDKDKPSYKTGWKCRRRVPTIPLTHSLSRVEHYRCSHVLQWTLSNPPTLLIHPSWPKMNKNACTESNLINPWTPLTHHKPDIPNSGRVERPHSNAITAHTCAIHTPTSNMPSPHTHTHIQSSGQERIMKNNEDKSNETRNHKCHRNLTILAISRRRRLQNNVYWSNTRV